MNRRLVASVAITISALGLGASMNGCSAAPRDADVGATREGITAPALGAGTNATVSCTTPFTYAQPQKCVRNPHGMTCGAAKCEGVLGSPTPPPAGESYMSFATTPPTPIPPPPQLAALGCTWGVQAQLTQADVTVNLWACPVNVGPAPSGTNLIPTNLGMAPPCTEANEGSVCEFHFTGQKIWNNSILGSPGADWLLVEEGTYLSPVEGDDDDDDGGHVLHACEGGCLNIVDNSDPSSIPVPQ